MKSGKDYAILEKTVLSPGKSSSNSPLVVQPWMIDQSLRKKRNDILSAMLTQIKNGGLRGKEWVYVLQTKLTLAVARILQKEGYITVGENCTVEQSDASRSIKSPPFLQIYLHYIDEVAGTYAPSISGIERISKPGLKVYSKAKDIPKVLGGRGVAIISTSKGIMSDREARAKGLGGEVLFHIW